MNKYEWRINIIVERIRVNNDYRVLDLVINQLSKSITLLYDREEKPMIKQNYEKEDIVGKDAFEGSLLAADIIEVCIDTSMISFTYDL